MVGLILPYGAVNPPSGWLSCNGSIVSRVQYSNLFNVIGTNFGNGDGNTTFQLPDLQGRTAIGMGSGAGLTCMKMMTSL